jgi:hypothetical protein
MVGPHIRLKVFARGCTLQRERHVSCSCNGDAHGFHAPASRDAPASFARPRMAEDERRGAMAAERRSR